MHFGQAPDEQVLRAVRILILVDEDVLELVRVDLAHALAGFDELDRLQQQVVEVERAGVGERPADRSRKSG